MKPYLISALSGALVVAACGGGGAQVAGIDRGGIEPPAPGVVSQGAITGFGSVIINGVTFDTSNTTFVIDGTAGSQSDLAVGQVIRVQGSLGDDNVTGVADTVSFDDTVEGPISAIDTLAGTLTVLGQLVRVDVDTSFGAGISPASLDGLDIDDVVEVSGFFLADGSVSATRIELRDTAGQLELTGRVSSVAGTTFDINGFVVDFTNASEIEGFPNGTPEAGQLVEAKGDALGGAGELLATRVEFKGGAFGAAGDRAEIEGFITRFDPATPSDFDVEGVAVITSAQTLFVNGSSADLALNRKVEVEGDINATGVLLATKVEIKASGFVRIESLVEDKSANQLTVLGIVVTVNAATRIEDKSSADVRPFSLAQIDVGNYVEIRGYEDSGGIVATRLEREDFRGDVALRGFVDGVSDPDFTILGVNVVTIGATQFRDLTGAVLTAGEFFAQANGRIVEASGTLNGSSITAISVQFEN